MGSVGSRTKPHAQAMRDPLHLAVTRPEQATVEIRAGEKVRVHVADASAHHPVFSREGQDLFVQPRRRADELLEVTEARAHDASAEAESQLGEHQGMNFCEPLAEKLADPTNLTFAASEGQPDLGVDADQLRIRRLRAVPARPSSNSSAKRSETTCLRRALRPNSTTSFRVVAAASFRRSRSSLTALVAWSSSAASISSVVRTGPTITPPATACVFQDTFPGVFPRTAGERTES